MDEPVEWASPDSNLSVMLGYDKVIHVPPGSDPSQRLTGIHFGLSHLGGKLKEVEASEFSPKILIVQPEIATEYLTGLERAPKSADGLMKLCFENVRTGGQEWGCDKMLVVEYCVKKL